MIRAEKGGLPGWLADAYVGRKLRGAFRGLWVRGRLPAGGERLVVYANHTNFWDGFVAHQLCLRAGWDGYCLMEEKNLSRYRFLRRLGAFSIRPGEGRSALESLRYAQALLLRPAAAVVIFPEGELRPFGEGPVRLQRGAELLARRAGVRMLPLALRYQFFDAELPDVLVEIGAPHPPESAERLEGRLQQLIDRLAQVRRLEGFELAVRGARGVAERWDAARRLPR